MHNKKVKIAAVPITGRLDQSIHTYAVHPVSNSRPLNINDNK